MLPQRTPPAATSATDAGLATHQAAMQKASTLLDYLFTEHTHVLSAIYSRECEQAGAVYAPTPQQADPLRFLHQLGLVQPWGQGFKLTILGKAVLALKLHHNISLTA